MSERTPMTRMMFPLLAGISAVLLAAVVACTSSPTQTPQPAPAPAPPPPAPARTYALPGDQVFPEGVAYDPTSNSFFTGSTSDGTIFRGDLGSGQVTVFSTGGSDGRTAAIGMKVDSQARRLWAAGGGTGLMFVYNIDSGDLIRKYTTPPAEQTFLNDVALAPNGDAYFTDSRRPVLFKIGGAGAQPGELENWRGLPSTASW